MRQLQKGQVLNVRAIGGSYVVTLAWDFAEGQDHKRTNLLGFAIERSELKNGNVIERYYLRGIKRFRIQGRGASAGNTHANIGASGTVVSMGGLHSEGRDHLSILKSRPSTADQNCSNWTKHPRPLLKSPRKQRKALGRPMMGPATISTSTGGSRLAGLCPKVSRGRTRREQASVRPDGVAVTRLVRGADQLHQAGGADDASDYKLRAMLYEFRYLPVGKAFKEAADAGADVDIRYEAQSYKDDNEAMIKKARIEAHLHAAEISRRHPTQQVYRAHSQGQAGGGLDRFHQHIGRRNFWSFQRRPRDLERGSRAELS